MVWFSVCTPPPPPPPPPPPHSPPFTPLHHYHQIPEVISLLLLQRSPRLDGNASSSHELNAAVLFRAAGSPYDFSVRGRSSGQVVFRRLVLERAMPEEMVTGSPKEHGSVCESRLWRFRLAVVIEEEEEEEEV